MTTEELNIAIAKRFGWSVKEVNGFFIAYTKGSDWSGLCHSEAEAWDTVPNKFATDANTRPEMLAVMSEDQKRYLVCLLIPKRPYAWTIDHSVKMLELPQLDFAAEWLEVMGKEKM